MIVYLQNCPPFRYFKKKNYVLCDIFLNIILPLVAGSTGLELSGEEGGMLEQVDEEVGGAVEHGEQVGEVGDVTDPVRPHQLTLNKRLSFTFLGQNCSSLLNESC